MTFLKKGNVAIATKYTPNCVIPTARVRCASSPTASFVCHEAEPSGFFSSVQSGTKGDAREFKNPFPWLGTQGLP